MCRLKTLLIAACLLVTAGCNSLVPMVPSESATAKAVIGQLTPGRTMTLPTLFDVAVKEANSRRLLSRESFAFLVWCQQSGISMRIFAESGPKWGDHTVWELQFPLAGDRDVGPSRSVRSTDQVRATLTSIHACESVMILIGGEKIEATLDERWMIQRVTHQPILSASESDKDPGVIPK